MTRASWVLAVVVLFTLGGSASAQTPPVTPSVPPVTVAAPAAIWQVPALDLSQLFRPERVSTVIRVITPTASECTRVQCRMGCQIAGCFSSCVDLATCTCEAICP